MSAIEIFRQLRRHGDAPDRGSAVFAAHARPVVLGRPDNEPQLLRVLQFGISDIIEATGLVKASLYHRFPGGKDEMVNAILRRVDKQFADYVLAPALAEGNARERAEQVAERIEEFYAGGKQWCLRIARDAGVPRAEAKKRAEDAVAAIEGGLVASRVLQNQGPFLRTMAALPERLTGR